MEERGRRERIDVVVKEENISARTQAADLAGPGNSEALRLEGIEICLCDLGAVLRGEFGDGGDFITRSPGSSRSRHEL